MKLRQIITIIFLLAATTGWGQTLDDYLVTAAENNPGLKAQYKEFEAALEEIPQVSSLQDPTLSFGYFISPVETRVGPQRARFSLNQMFPWFGTLAAREDAAALMAQARYQLFLDARNRLFYQVAAAYYPIYELKQLMQIERENIRILESYKTISVSKFENGNAPMADVLRVDIMLQDALTNLQILEDKEQALVPAFNNLLNRDESATVVVPDSLFAQPLDILIAKDSLIYNPKIEAVNLRILASEASELAARKNGMPKLGAGLDYVVVGERTDMDLADNGKDVIMPMVSVSIPLFRKKYKAAVNEAQHMQESYRFEREEIINSLSTEYEITRFDLARQLELLDLYNAQMVTTNQTINLLFSSYSNSGREFEEVLRMQQQLLRYKKEKAEATMQFYTALARLHYLTAKTY